MKKLISFGLICFSLTIGHTQNLFRYINNNERHYFEICTDRTIILVNERVTEDVIEKSLRGSASLQVSETLGRSRFRLVSFYSGGQNTVSGLASQWENNDTILFVGQIIIDEKGEKTAALTNQINVRLKNDGDFPILQRAIALYDIYKIEQDEFDSRSYLLIVNYSSGKSVLQIANELHKTGLFEFAEPNLLLFIRYETNDTHFSRQWGLRNTGQNGGASGIDIRAPHAWNITTGSPNIRIAIVDLGVDLNHPDLNPNLIPGLGFDATGGGNGGHHSGNPHGTAVAGVVAARGNNSRGIAGVAYNSTILPIHMGDAPLANRVAAGINWAIENNARVINMSFSTENTQAVRTALNNATAAEIVLVTSAGNSGVPSVTFPGGQPGVITVGSIDNDGHRSYFSNFGTNLDVVAPGSRIYTTGILGATGHGTVINNGVNGVYFSNFRGTSAAAPHVAGVAALILSIRPEFTQAQVRQAIESTARRISPLNFWGNPIYRYSNQPNRPHGTWNNEMGHGLVDAYSAIKFVMPRITGPYTLCDPTAFTITNLPQDATVTWRANPNITPTTATGQTVTFNRNPTQPTGPALISATINLPNGLTISLNKEVHVGVPNNQWITTRYNLTRVNPGLPFVDYVLYQGLSVDANLQHIHSAQWQTVPNGNVSINVLQDGTIPNERAMVTAHFPGSNTRAQVQIRLWNQCGASHQWTTIEYLRPPTGGGGNPTLPPLCPICFGLDPNCFCQIQGPPGNCGMNPCRCAIIWGAVHPNPVDNILTIDLTQVSEARTDTSTPLSDRVRASTSARTNASEVFYIRLLNAHGMIVRQQRTSAATVQFDVSNLPEGTYYLHIEHGGEIEKHQIIVQRN